MIESKWSTKAKEVLVREILIYRYSLQECVDSEYCTEFFYSLNFCLEWRLCIEMESKTYKLPIFVVMTFCESHNLFFCNTILN